MLGALWCVDMGLLMVAISMTSRVALYSNESINQNTRIDRIS